MMSITGTPDTVPLRVGFPVADSVGGLVAAMSICAALAGRARTGEGVSLDVSMLEASLSAMGWAASNYLVSGVAPEPMGDQNATAAPSGTFDTADGPLNIAANRQEQFEVLCRLVGREDLVADERFADREARKANRAALNRELTAALRRRTALEWEQLLSGAGVPAARILTVPQAVQLEQLRVRGFFTDLPFPAHPERTLRVSGNGVLVNGSPLRPTAPPPLLGEHNGEEQAGLLPAAGEVTAR
jgi:crotonobetainyl-CoA:carnitine CoA-transferase CaiB-like acyl-CoA transferase